MNPRCIKMNPLDLPEIAANIMSHITDIQDITRAERINKVFAEFAWSGLTELSFSNVQDYDKNDVMCGRTVRKEKIQEALTTVWRKALNLRTLVLSGDPYSQIEWNHLEHIMIILGSSNSSSTKRIAKLDLSQCRVVALPTANLIRSLSGSLQELHVQFCLVRGMPVDYEQTERAIWSSVGHCSMLQKFSLRGTGIRADGAIEEIVPAFSELENLNKLIVEDASGTSFWYKSYGQEFLSQAMEGLSNQQNRRPGFRIEVDKCRYIIESDTDVVYGFVTEICIQNACSISEQVINEQNLPGLFPNLELFTVPFDARNFVHIVETMYTFLQMRAYVQGDKKIVVEMKIYRSMSTSLENFLSSVVETLGAKEITGVEWQTLLLTDVTLRAAAKKGNVFCILNVQ